MSEIIIKKGTVILKCNKEDLIEVSETHDGIAFNFKGGLQLYNVDADMPIPTKKLITQATDSFSAPKVIIDLLNLRKPAIVDAT